MRKNISIDNTQTFRQAILHSLSKLNDPHTQSKGEEEFRDICELYGQDIDRISLVISILNDSYERDHNIRLSAKKEYVKLYGVAAEIYGFKILEFFPKILQNLNKKLKEQDNSLHQNIGDSFGALIEHSLKQLTTQEALPFITQVLALLFQNFQANSKYPQIGSSIALSRVIQSCPLESLYELTDDIMLKITECLQQPQQFKAQSNILEALLSVLVGIEQRFRKYCQVVLPLIIDNMTDQAWSVRKIAVDIIYTLAILMPNELIPFSKQCMDILSQSRFDKIKHVRDASIVALNVIKELNPNSNNNQNQIQNNHSQNTSQVLQRDIDESSLMQMPNDPLEEMIDQPQIHHQQQSPYSQHIGEQKPKKQTFKTQKIRNQKSPFKAKNGFPSMGSRKHGQGSMGQDQFNAQPKESIFKGPKNQNFFKNAAKEEVQILVNENNKKELQPAPSNLQNNSQYGQQQPQYSPPIYTQQSQQNQPTQQTLPNQQDPQSIQQTLEQQQQSSPQLNTEQNQIQTQQSKSHFAPQPSQDHPYTQPSMQNTDELNHKIQEISNKQIQINEKIQIIEQDQQQEIQTLNKRIDFLEDLIEKVYNMVEKQNQNQNILSSLNQQQQQTQQVQTGNFQNLQNMNNDLNLETQKVLLAQQLLNNNNNINNGNNNFMTSFGGVGQQQLQNQQILQQQMQLFNNNNNNNNLNNNINPSQPFTFNNANSNNIRSEIEKNKQQIKQQQQQKNNIIDDTQQSDLNLDDSNIQQSKKRAQWDVQNQNQQPKLSESIFKPSEIIEKNMQQQKQTLQQLNNDSSINFNEFNLQFKKSPIKMQQQQQQQQNSDRKYQQKEQQGDFNNEYMQPPKRFSPHKDLMSNQYQQQQKKDAHFMEHNVTEKISNGIKEQKYNEVYGLVLISNDDKLILNTMEQTGICVQQLDEIHLEFLLTKLKSYLFRNDYVQESLPWIYKTIVELRIKISNLLVRSMRETLKRLLDNNSTSHFMQQKDVIMAQKILGEISNMQID